MHGYLEADWTAVCGHSEHNDNLFAGHFVDHVQSLLQSGLAKGGNVVCIELQLLWCEAWILLERLHMANELLAEQMNEGAARCLIMR